ncbi:MAG: hypothetical protein GY765_22695, partial [bacterium]|nr:hypothetical protein [bacterium]
EIRPAKNQSTTAVELTSRHLPVTVSRNRDEIRLKENTPFVIGNGDVVKLEYYKKSARGRSPALLIKFRINADKGVPYLAVSYRESGHTAPTVRGDKGNRNAPDAVDMAFLKNLDTGVTYTIHKNKTNRFIGGRGLFSLHPEPRRLLEKLYIPAGIPEGGMVDFKEMLDRRLYYRKAGRFYPVTDSFLEELEKAGEEGDKFGIARYLEIKHIQWLFKTSGKQRKAKKSTGGENYVSNSRYRDLMKNARRVMFKMENKRLYKTFCREIERLNKNHHIYGIGLTGAEIRNVTYKPAGHSRLNAREVTGNIPVVPGIS